ncbi:Ribosomal protein L9/RNase H1, N-terminal [Sesbania bispinosa]|nr:Ribosomal protein L9/RNase H1, N-terminal [Sesbania bispinosa]
MSSSRDVKFYVVFHGRQPGIYGSWEECEIQVLGYSGNKHKSFKTLEEAQIAWSKHCKKMSHFHNYTQYADDGDHKRANPGGSSSNSDKQKTPLHDMGINKNMILEEDGSDEFIIHCSMQEWLRQVCHTLRITQPRITLAEVMNFMGVTYYRIALKLHLPIRMEAPNLSVDMNAKNVNFGYREGILKEADEDNQPSWRTEKSAKATHTNTAVNHYCPSNATIKVLGDSIEKVRADLYELKKDVNNESAQLKEVTKQILTKFGLFQNSLPDKCQVKSTTNATGAPTSVDVNDSVHEDLSPKSMKNQTPPASNIKRKPISSTSQVNMTRRIGDIQTVEIVNSDDEILPAKNNRKKDCSSKTMCTTKHNRLGGQVQEITSVGEKSKLQVGEGISNAMKVVNRDLMEENAPTKGTKPPYRLRSHSASKQPSSMVGGVGKILKFSSTPTKCPK